MRLCAVILACAALVAGPAAAQRRPPVPVRPAPAPIQAPVQIIPTRLTAKGLSAICAQNEGACITYVLGAIDAFVATDVVNFNRIDLCFPPQATNQQIANVAIAYVRAHPEAQDRSAAMVVLQGLRASFPCHLGQ
jgi:hypothetical protein